MPKQTRRVFLSQAAALGAAATLPIGSLRAANANDEIGLGFISCGGRARNLMSAFSGVKGANIVGLCDPDESRVASAKKKYPQATGYSDLRDLIDAKDVDAVVIATCNHWHCLAAIWAMQAGKDVYVEKPLSHSQWEGLQTVAAARKYDRICQIGTQQRSDPMQDEIKAFLHQDKKLGDLQVVRVNRYGVRPAIGKRSTPLEIPETVNYDLWLGPARDEPLFRDKLHYDWHWDWNTGSGEMGNWGVHVLDDVRNNVFQDRVKLPKKIIGGGGRVVYGDAGNTPNVHFTYFDTDDIPVVIGLSNLPAKPGAKGKAAPHPGPGSGYVVYCEGGRFEGHRGGASAYDENGKLIQKFKGDSGKRHQQNFVDAVRKRDRSLLNAEIQVGHDSTGWCNLANIAYQSGGAFSMDEAKSVYVKQWQDLLADMQAHLGAHDLTMDAEAIKMSPMLTMDPEKEQFVGAHADKANTFLKRQYRKGYEVPNLT
ncbi:Inositol 2-dehydrogenase [Planctomycetes bacterium Pan216]|uniref:Inositol 2-dehydrogenase n=1 Tax=Kolteria novifilia TaxID=2527975 RepID=A0A518B482_9BACT|nr:Inositol 2-dehydrogenase [Planctomycetes bacterium Pan216]